MSDTHESPTVLIVEDDPGLMELYQLWLRADYELRIAFDGERALELVDGSVSVVLLDRRLPGLSGDEVLDRIRELGLDCQVVMVSAAKPNFDVLEMQFDDFVTKPMTREEIRETVARMNTLATYDRPFRSLYALVSKKAALEAELSQRELDPSEEYAALAAEISDLRAQIAASPGDEHTDDFDRVFQGAL